MHQVDLLLHNIDTDKMILQKQEIKLQRKMILKLSQFSQHALLEILLRFLVLTALER